MQKQNLANYCKLILRTNYEIFEDAGYSQRLYLYSDESMSEKDFLIRKKQLSDDLQELNESIGLATTESWNQAVSDEEFIERASQFIISKII